MKHTPGATAGLGTSLALTALGSQVLNGLFIGLAVFTLIGAGLALVRTLPKIHLEGGGRRGEALGEVVSGSTGEV